jgi:rubredoxin
MRRGDCVMLKWESVDLDNVPEDWVSPECGVGEDSFEPVA